MMNEREARLLDKRRKELSQVIRAQHVLPKRMRNQEKITDAQTRLRIIDKWIDGKENSYIPVISKAEFKEYINRELSLPEPEHSIIIDDIETLESAWPTVLANNIQMQVNQNNPALIKRFKELVREHKAEALKRRG